MRKLSLVALISTACLLIPSLASTGIRSEGTALSVTDGTTDQTSEVIVKPAGARGMYIIIDVTAAGGTLSMDILLKIYSHGLGDALNWSQTCPSAGGITGVSETVCVFYPTAQTNGAGTIDEDFVLALPSYMKIMMDVDDTTTATYDVYYGWLW